MALSNNTRAMLRLLLLEALQRCDYREPSQLRVHATGWIRRSSNHGSSKPFLIHTAIADASAEGA